MSLLYSLVGLPPAERALAEAVLSMDEHDAEAIVQTQVLADAHLLIVNSDDAASVRRLRQQHTKAFMLLVGARVSGVDAAAVGRPLTADGLMQALGKMAQQAQFGQPAREAQLTEPTSSPQALSNTVFDAGLPTSLPPDKSSARAGAKHAATHKATEPDAPILVVTQLGKRTLTLPRGLRRMGYRVQVVENRSAVMQHMARGKVRALFLDHTTLGDEWLPMARQLAALREEKNAEPYVAVVTRGGTIFEQLRAHAVGCVWIKVPVVRERLLSYLRRRGLHPDAVPSKA